MTPQPSTARPYASFGRRLVLLALLIAASWLGVWWLQPPRDAAVVKDALHVPVAPEAVIASDVPGHDAGLLRHPVLPSGEGSLQPSVVPASLVHVMISVLNIEAKPVVGARVLVTDREVFGDLGAINLEAQLRGGVVVADARTGASGALLLELECDTAYYIRVESASGLRGAGPRLIKPRNKVGEHCSYVVGDLYGGAIVLSDGKIPIYVDWSIDALSPILSPEVLRIKSDLAERLAVDPIQVLVQVLGTIPPDNRCGIAVCHPELGWFRATADLVRVGDLRNPTLVPVPASGDQKPVKVLIRCVNPQGEEVQAQVRLTGGRFRPGSLEGWPRFGKSFLSGEPQLVPPGQLEISFADPCLMVIGPRRVDVLEAQTITMVVPFTPKTLRLRLEKDGVPFVGRPVVSVYVPSLAKRFGARSAGSLDGVVSLSVPAELPSELKVVADEWSAEHNFVPTPGQPVEEIVIRLR